MYAAKDGYAKLSTIASHQSFVTHVDFSTDGNYVQSADGAGALLFADAATGIQIPSGLKPNPSPWDEASFPLRPRGFHVQHSHRAALPNVIL